MLIFRKRIGRLSFPTTVGLLLLAAAIGCNGSGPAGVKGSGILKSESRTAAAFSAIDVSSVVKLNWEPKTETSVDVTAEDNVIASLVTEVQGDTLKIYFKGNFRLTKDAVVTVGSPALKALTAG